MNNNPVRSPWDPSFVHSEAIEVSNNSVFIRQNLIKIFYIKITNILLKVKNVRVYRKTCFITGSPLYV